MDCVSAAEEFAKHETGRASSMAVTPPENTSGTRPALREVVAEYGPTALSRPATMSNLLKKLLPDARRVARMLVAAAEDSVADALCAHVPRAWTLPRRSGWAPPRSPPPRCSP